MQLVTKDNRQFVITALYGSSVPGNILSQNSKCSLVLIENSKREAETRIYDRKREMTTLFNIHSQF